MADPIVTLTPPPLPAPAAVERLVLKPGVLRAWRGLWTLTWRSQLTWRRVPMLLVTLLTVPLLAYFTIEPMQKLGGDNDWRQQPGQIIRQFRAEAGQMSGVLRSNLVQIIAEEQGRVPPLVPDGTADSDLQFTEGAIERAVAQAQACHARISERVRSILDQEKYAAFERFQERKLGEAIAAIRNLNMQQVKPYFSWLLNFYFFLALPLYCLSACGSMIRDELQSDTIGFLVTRPVGRARLFLLKYLCQVQWLQAMVAVHGLLLLAVGSMRHVPGVGAMLPLFLGTQFLAVLSWGALSALLGLVTRRYMLLGVAYGAIVEFGLGRIPTNINALALTRHLRGLLAHHPLLQRLYDWAPQDVASGVGALLLATIIFLGIGAALWAQREYHQATEMQR